MLYLISGTPGASKTLNTIKRVKELSEKEGRPVFYWNIRNLSKKLGWHELSVEDAKKWFDLPAGSIIIFDEAYDLFPAWGQKKEPEEHVKRIATHRHLGLDIFMIFQDPSKQMSDFLKGLVESHTHYERVGGSKLIRIMHWNGYQGSLRSNQARRDAVITTSRIDKSIFELYDSAEVHTDKFRFRLKPFLAISICFLATVFALFQFTRGATGLLDNKPLASEAHAVQQQQQQIPLLDPRDLAPSSYVDLDKPKELGSRDLSRYQERLQGMPWTAPIYDEVRPVVSYPRPAACIKSDKGCTCYTQQATPLSGVSDAFCENHVKNGYFDDTIPDVRSHHVQNLQEFSKPPQSANKPLTRSEAVYSF